MREPKLTYDDFISILQSLGRINFGAELARAGNRVITTMVLGGNNPNHPLFPPGDANGAPGDNNNNPIARLQAMRAASCIKILGKGVIKVVHRVDDAKENCNLDLSHCQLVQVPDAIYYMMRNTPLVVCNLSDNVITKIPPKLPVKFSFIKKLNLSQNRLSALPEEVSELTQLETVDISHNAFVNLPTCLFSAPKVTEINASNNFIAEVEVDLLSSSPQLKTMLLESNPLSRDCEAVLASFSGVQVTFSHRELEEWEDLEL